MLNKIDNLKRSELITRYPELSVIESHIVSAVNAIAKSFANGGKLITMGNGGSSADAEHICGELVKSFIKERPLNAKEISLFRGIDKELPQSIQGSLPAISLGVQHSTISAFSNDKNPAYCFAQQIWGLGFQNDIILGITTSGNSTNVIHGLKVAKAKGITTVVLTGSDGGAAAGIADVVIKVPAKQTHHIQELHLPIYHSLCIELEDLFF